MLRFTIAKKLMLLVSIALLGFVISQVYSLWVERANSSRLAEVEKRIYPTLELTTVNLGSLLLMEQQINSSVTTGDAQVLADSAAHYEQIRKNLAQLSSLSSDLSSQVKVIDDQLQTWYSTATRIAESFINSTVNLEQVGAEASANAERLQNLRDSLATMKSETAKRFNESISETVESSQAAAQIALAIAAGAVVALIAIRPVLYRRCSAPLMIYCKPSMKSRSLLIMLRCRRRMPAQPPRAW